MIILKLFFSNFICIKHYAQGKISNKDSWLIMAFSVILYQILNYFPELNQLELEENNQVKIFFSIITLIYLSFRIQRFNLSSFFTVIIILTFGVFLSVECTSFCIHLFKFQLHTTVFENKNIILTIIAKSYYLIGIEYYLKILNANESNTSKKDNSEELQ